ELALSDRTVALYRSEHAQHDTRIAGLLKLAIVPHTGSPFRPAVKLPCSRGERQDCRLLLYPIEVSFNRRADTAPLRRGGTGRGERAGLGRARFRGGG